MKGNNAALPLLSDTASMATLSGLVGLLEQLPESRLSSAASAESPS